MDNSLLMQFGYHLDRHLGGHLEYHDLPKDGQWPLTGQSYRNVWGTDYTQNISYTLQNNVQRKYAKYLPNCWNSAGSKFICSKIWLKWTKLFNMSRVNFELLSVCVSCFTCYLPFQMSLQHYSITMTVLLGHKLCQNQTWAMVCNVLPVVQLFIYKTVLLLWNGLKVYTTK